jgi:hypothetical protein
MKIGKTYFNPEAKEAIKAMGFEGFKKVYSKLLKGDLKAHFEKLTGEKVKSTRKKKDD